MGRLSNDVSILCVLLCSVCLRLTYNAQMVKPGNSRRGGSGLALWLTKEQWLLLLCWRKDIGSHTIYVHGNILVR